MPCIETNRTIGSLRRRRNSTGIPVMRSLTRPSFALLIALGTLAAAGCASQNTADTNSSRLGSPGYGSGQYGRWGKGRAGATAMLKNEVGDLVYFASDSSDLTPEAQQTLASQARFLQQNQNLTVTIEGHADERGTREYNIALGARRATSVRNYLARMGINASRVRTISYGKERPVAACDDISCWSQNRRAQTVLNGAYARQYSQGAPRY